MPDITRSAKSASYGWGMIPVEVSIGGITFNTALFPKDDGYLLPIKADRATKDRRDAVEMTIGAPVPSM